MAPITRNGSYRPNGYTNVDMAGFNPPPSTMAAQLINDLSTTGNQPSRQVDAGSLEILMSQVANAETEAAQRLEEDPEFVEDLDKKLERKHKLIYVFSRALLDRIASDDPFKNVTQLVKQTEEALDLFLVTLRESPEVLDYTLPAGEQFLGRGQEPLWKWLFPRLLALLGRKGCERLTKKINNIFLLSYRESARIPRMWGLSSTLFRYLKECVTTTLSHLELPSILSNHQDLNVAVLFDLDASLCSDDTPSHSPGCSYMIRHASEGLLNVSSILLILVEISKAAAVSYDATAAFRDYLAWLLDSFIRTLEVRNRWKANPALLGACTKMNGAFISSLADLLSSLRDFLWPISLRKGYSALSIICAEFLSEIDGLSEELCVRPISSVLLNIAAMCRRYDSICRVVSIHLVPAMSTALANEDTSTACTLLCQACGALSVDEFRDHLGLGFENPDLLLEFRSLGLEDNSTRGNSEDLANDGPPTKRRRINNDIKLFDKITADLYELLGAQRAIDLTGLNQVAGDCFEALLETDRCKAIELLGRMPCAISGTLTVTRADGKTLDAKCSICDGLKLPFSIEPPHDAEKCDRLAEEATLTFTKLITSPAFLASKRVRVLAMFALRRFALHFQDPEFIDLEVSPLGQWCYSSLKSSTRELRLAAGRTLPFFLRGASTAESLTRKNRTAVMAFLRSLPEQENIIFQETAVLAWGQIARIVKDDELNIVLLALIGYLGHSNPIISGAAFSEIPRIAKAADLTVEKLLSSFWSSVATAAVTDLLVKPQTAQLIADLLGISVAQFLVLTQSYTLPFLVLNQKFDVIKKISEARLDGDNYAVCLDPSNLAPILALLLVQNVPDLDSYIMGLLRRVSSEFKGLDLGDLTTVEPMYQALYLLKAAGQADESQKSRIRFALQFLATRGSENQGSKKNSVTGIFLKQHLLGIVARIVDVISAAKDEQMMTEKERSVKAIEELVKLAQKHARTARPQLCACLQVAFEHPELQACAFSAWESMLRYLGDDDVETMLESTFSLIIQHWKTFNTETRARAEATLQYLNESRGRLIRNMIFNLPSLSGIKELADVERKISRQRTPTDVSNGFLIFKRRLGHEDPGVVAQTLVELKAYLRLNQSFLQTSAVSEQPDLVVGQLVRSILDTCVKYNEWQNDIAVLSAECLGLIGCLDPNRVESVRERREMVVVSNFRDQNEATDFVLYILQEVIVPAFLSAKDPSLQGFFSYVMQELLEKCNFKDVVGDILRTGEKKSTEPLYRKWVALPVRIQEILTPFLTSKYSLAPMEMPKYEYPIFRPDAMPPQKLYNAWLRGFTLDLLQKPFHLCTQLIFPPLCRAIRIKDVSVASFILPYLVLHAIIDGTDKNREDIGAELLSVLEYDIPADSPIRREDMKSCVETVFRILDYLARWMQEKQVKASSRGQIAPEAEHEILLVKSVVETIPPELISHRAIQCESYSRALFYWEQHIRDVRGRGPINPDVNTAHLQRLQDIYTQIDEPDGIEGISAHLHVLDIDQQILGHRKAGRWTAAQSWYEIQLAETPEDVDVQLNLLTCLKELGQHDVLLNYVEGMHNASQTVSKLLPFAAEASWATGRWATLAKYSSLAPPGITEDFNVNVGRALLALHAKNTDLFKSRVAALREKIARSVSNATTSSLGTSHDTILKFHVLTELEMIAGADNNVAAPDILESLNRRLEVIGAFLNDKQYLLGIRRAAMQLSGLEFSKGDIAAAWLTSARLARKGNAMHQSFNAVLHASQLGDQSAMIEHAKLLWKEGHHRKAIQNLQGAIQNNAFFSHNKTYQATSFTTDSDKPNQQNLLTARAHLLYAKWLDSAGQTQSSTLRVQYQLAAKTHSAWEKGHYYLGRHYNKLLESEKALPPDRQNDTLLTGETAKLVIENYLRALTYGTKYLYQTLPRILTLWLDLGSQVQTPVKHGTKEYAAKINELRKGHLDGIHLRFNKYITRTPAYMFYTALPQIVARIAHSNNEVYKYLQTMIHKVVSTYPQQALWTLLAVCTSTQSDRRTRGGSILQNLRSAKKPDSNIDIRALIKNGEKLTEQLLLACNSGDFQGNRTTTASLTKDLGFISKHCLPSPLAVPVESVLTATLPTLTDNIKTHKAFSRDIVTIESFLDEVLVLSSLQKPRKLTARGSDGKTYGIMCKPKDDLRKDQRLMEFNSMINRSLKRDAESSRRQLYIKTYAVTPLNEECGLIEWVDGLKTLRDILLGLYRAIGVAPNYNEIALYCEEATKSEDKLPFFTEKVLGIFPPMFHRWFVAQFPEPSAWFAARLRYTRSCAVMSMVGTILGLGDRHGENILFEEGNGGTFHVDFNCLFDKGLTFVKPERVPFRLTHNMVDAMGMYGYEGPFRKSSELTLKLLRQHEETLMTILESFVYDPTLDLLTSNVKKRKKDGVPQTAQGVLDSIQRKVKGLLPGESVPLGVEGQVDELIKMATNQTYLAGMYIGWCSFF
ncbi:phosphatidylinositol 3 [Drepanopeziza brunnea f. sp. 'multigermtubi' MB_m1]|uniref:Serine/threonine-protein kinase MEC1 n=1 Tax=Marssonina brunnea f. sp. multigermtubi (strain MB_m1) TaxID=1072389 RepID=K1WPJ9_MARBU|nr:phosphatidylinositol 3 [Drepanopeziza brunnea f. sp. 'multigermtubi' MB_m1]EKD14277.1 phosphatidylinositol 3 [Drepanopeziza brunnea f. sp. 'multigermtubi' MB_m1]